jgi:hypothetical protein
MPKTATLRDRYVAALLARGCIQIASTSRRYVIFEAADHTRYYLGKNGSLRVGRTIADSVPVGDRQRQFLLKEADRLQR